MFSYLRHLAFVLLTLTAGVVLAAGNERTLNVSGSDAGTGKRLALVIGNAAYPGVGALKNSANDARDFGNKLKRLGFEVTLRTDLKQKDMLRALTEFGGKVVPGTEALFFYAGHGLQVKGRNYLIPVDAEIRQESDVSSEAIDVDQLLDKLAPARLSMVILDACRNNPFERRFRGGGQGLAQINAPTGTLIAYATAPGKVAADGDGRNGLYTSELLAAMDIPGIKIEDVFKHVRSNVVRKSGDAQTPWESSSLTGDFYFSAPNAARATAESHLAAPGSQPPPSNSLSPEIIFWDSIRNSNNANEYRAYLEKYPNGEFVAIARARIDELQRPLAAPEKPALERILLGAWKFGRSVGGGLFFPAGHLCDVTLSATRGTHGNLISSCDSNESYWRVRGENLEFINKEGHVTTLFSNKDDNSWEGPYLGSSPGSSAYGIIHYLRR